MTAARVEVCRGDCMRHHLITALTGIGLFVLPNILLAQAQGQGRGRGQAPAPARPAPRWPDGRPNFGPLPGELGVWLPGNARFAEPEDGGRGARGANPALAALLAPVPGAPLKPKVTEVPWQPWAKGVFDYRLQNQF